MKRIKTGILLLAAAVNLTACSSSASNSITASASSEAASSEAVTAISEAISEAVSSETTAPSESTPADNVHVIDGVTFIVLQVPNDKTGNWRFSSISESFDMSEHALEYYNECFGSDSEVHYIINEADHTTTQINYASGNLDVMVRERVDKEEFDASTLGNGSIQAEYFVDVSTGEIEKA